MMSRHLRVIAVWLGKAAIGIAIVVLTYVLILLDTRVSTTADAQGRKGEAVRLTGAVRQ